MFNTQSFGAWQARWDALQLALAQIPAVSDIPRHDTIKQLRLCLQAFGGRQFLFFRDGFDPDQQQHRVLEPSVEFPVDYVFNALLQQVSYDMTVIGRAAMDRAGDEADALAQADQLAQRAIDPAVRAGLIEETAVLTYTNKSANIRNIPYAPLALIAIPYTALGYKRDLLATAHEVGHQVYRHSRLQRTGFDSILRHEVADGPLWLQRWLEEIFADVYGCLIGGPVMALNFQALLLTHERERFINDDGEHPVEPIRPYIYTTVLSEMGFGAAAGQLEERWESVLEQRGVPATFALATPEPDGSEAAGFEDAREWVEEVALRILNTVLAPVQDSHSGFWSSSVKIDALYDEFEAFLDAVPQAPLAELRAAEKDPQIVGVQRDGRPLANTRRLGETVSWLDMMTGANTRQIVWPAKVWWHALGAAGWNTSGPDEDPEPP